MIRALAATSIIALAVAGGAFASEERPTLDELEREVVCPVCAPETLAMSNSPVAERMRAFIRGRIAAGDTKSEIKAKLVAEFGEGVLAAPPTRGFNLLAWLLPLVAAALAAGVVGVLAVRWQRARDEPAEADPSRNGRGPLDPDLERRLDEELARFDA